jgi:hypothetical protein
MLPFLPKILFSLKSSWHRYQPFIKIFIGFFLLGILFWRIPLPERIFSNLADNFEWVIAVIFLYFIGILLSSLKLYMLLQCMGERISGKETVKAYYIGTFFNTFLPTTIGGDVVKLQYIRTSGIGGYTASAGIVMERATGLSAAMVMVGFVFLFGKGFTTQIHLGDIRFYLAALIFVTLTITWGACIWGGEKLQNKIKPLDNHVVTRVFERFLESLNLLVKQTRGLLTAFVISLLFYLTLAVMISAAAISVQENVPLQYAIQMMPLIALVSALPISIGGLGVLEGITTFCLIAVGIDPGHAFSIALLIRLCQWFHSGIGGLLFLSSSRRHQLK